MEQKVAIITGIALVVLAFIALVIVPRFFGKDDDIEERIKKSKMGQAQPTDPKVKEKQDQ